MKDESMKLAHGLGGAIVQRLENQILEETSEVVLGATRFAEVTEEQTTPPEAWVEEYGEDRARRMLEVAKEAKKPAAQAAIGLRMAQQTMVGITKARASSKRGNYTLNMTVVKMPEPPRVFPVRKPDE